MTIAFVASVSGHSTTSNGFTTGSVDTTGSNFIVINLSTLASGGVLSDSKSNTWTALTQQVGAFADRQGQLFYCENPTVGSGHTFSVTGTATYPALCIAGYSGVATSSSFDVQSGQPGGFGNNVTAVSVTPGQDNELVIAGLTYDDASVATVDSGFTVAETQNNTGFGWTPGQLAYIIETTATAKAPKFSYTGASRGIVVMATFKSSAAAAGIPNKIYQTNFAVNRAAHY